MLFHDSMLLPVLILLLAPAVEPGFVPLFDGKTLNGWIQVDKRGSGYLVEDGKIVCPPDGGASPRSRRASC